MLLLAACDASKPYPDLADKNLRIQTASAGASVVMAIYGLMPDCSLDYQGTVALNQPVVHIGLAARGRTRLVFEFRSSGLLARTSIKKEAQIAPRAGYRYDARVTYKDEVYGLTLREIDPRTGEARELDPMASC